MSKKAQGIVEYALLLAFVVVVAAVLVSDDPKGGLSGSIRTIFNDVQMKILSVGN